VKIATAAEPERGEGKRGESYEILAQVDKSAILKLGEAAGFARHEEDFETTRVSGDLVAAKSAAEIGVILETGGEDDGVFDGQTGALTEIGADGMSSVAEDGNATDNPGKGCHAVLNFCADRAFGVFDEFRDGSVPAGKEFAQGIAFGHIGRTQGVVGSGVPVDAPGAEAQDAEAPAVAVGFGKVAVLLEAEVASLAFRFDVGHAAPDAVRPIGESAFEAEGSANGGMNAITCDDEIGFGRSAIFKVKKHGVGALFELRKGVVEVDGAGRHGIGEGGLQFGAMNASDLAIGDGEGESFYFVAARVFHDEPAERAAAGLQPGKDARVNLIEGPDGVRPEAHAGAYFFQFGCALINVNIKADFTQGDGGGESADAAANDCRTFHNCPQSMRPKINLE